MADARPGPLLDQSAWEPEGEHDSGVPDVAVNESTNLSAVWGIATAQRTHHTFELAGKIGKRPVSVLLDSGSTGNFVSAQMCIAQKWKIEKDDYDEELKMADGTTVTTAGRVKIQLQCGGYRGVV